MAVKFKAELKASSVKQCPQAGAEFVKSLAAYEKALADCKKNVSERAIDDCLSAVKAVGAAANKAIKANKKNKDAAAFLEAFEPLVSDEVERLETAKKAIVPPPADEEETGDELVFDSGHLSQCLKLLRSRELNFACGVHGSPEQSRIIFDRKKAPKRLFQLLKGNKELELPANRLTFGIARPDPANNSTMVLALDEQAEQPVGLIKKLQKLFMKRKEEYRPFRDVKLMVGGKFVEDVPDPEDTEPENINEQATAHDPQGAAASVEASAVKARLKKTTRLRKARQDWVQAREQARRNMAQVKAALLKAYRRDATQLPLVIKKLKTLDAVFDGLTDELRKQLDAYLTTPPRDTQTINRLESQLRKSLQSYRDRVSRDTLLAAVDDDQELVPQLQIKAPLLHALQRLEQAVAT